MKTGLTWIEPGPPTNSPPAVNASASCGAENPAGKLAVLDNAGKINTHVRPFSAHGLYMESKLGSTGTSVCWNARRYSFDARHFSLRGFLG